jgi:hypothetical protein
MRSRLVGAGGREDRPEKLRQVIVMREAIGKPGRGKTRGGAAKNTAMAPR